jgi:hypothetical protein
MKMLRPTGGGGGKSACWTWREIWIDIWVVGFWRQLFNQRRRCSFFFLFFLFFSFYLFIIYYYSSYLSLSPRLWYVYIETMGCRTELDWGALVWLFCGTLLKYIWETHLFGGRDLKNWLIPFIFCFCFVVFPTLFFLSVCRILLL